MPNIVNFNHGRGSFSEVIMRNTIRWYEQQQIALIHQSLPEWTKQKLQFRTNRSVQCDYIGLFASHYVELEVKETNQQSFCLYSIKPHQWRRLTMVLRHGGISFLLLCFSEQQLFFLVPFATIQNRSRRFTLTIPDLVKIGYQLTLTHHLTFNLIEKIRIVIDRNH